MKIDPRMMIQFAVIAEEASFTRASARLQVAQPWLSARIRKLEDQIGFSLLTRSTRSVVLTERGGEFLQAAREVAVAVEAAEALAAQLERQNGQRLRIGVPPYSGRLVERRERIDGFTAAHGDVSVELDVGWSPSLLTRLRSGELDIAFAMGEIDDPDLETTLLRRVGVGLMMSPDNPLATAPILLPEHLRGHTVHVFTRALNPGLFDDLYGPLISVGVPLTQTAGVADNLPDHLQSQTSITAFFDFGADPGLDGAIVRRSLSAPATAPFWLVRRRNSASPVARSFWAMAI